MHTCTMQKPHTGSQQVFSSTVMHFKLKAQILWVVLFNFASFRAFCPKAVQSTYFPVSFSEGKWSLCRLASSCVLRGRLWTKQRVSVSCITGHRFSKPLFELRPDAGRTVLAAVRHQAFRLGAFYLSGLYLQDVRPAPRLFVQSRQQQMLAYLGCNSAVRSVGQDSFLERLLNCCASAYQMYKRACWGAPSTHACACCRQQAEVK